MNMKAFFTELLREILEDIEPEKQPEDDTLGRSGAALIIGVFRDNFSDFETRYPDWSSSQVWQNTKLGVRISTDHEKDHFVLESGAFHLKSNPSETQAIQAVLDGAAAQKVSDSLETLARKVLEAGNAAEKHGGAE